MVAATTELSVSNSRDGDDERYLEPERDTALDENQTSTVKGLSGLSTKKLEAIALLMEGEPVTRVAEAVGVDRTTVHRWLNDETFKRELRLKRNEFIDTTFDFVAWASSLSLLKLVELLDSKNERISLDAARSLSSARRDYVAIDHEQRMRQLENID